MMTDGTLRSTNWYRVATLKPRLRPGTRIQPQVLRGQEWYVFTHPVSGRHYRLNRKTYELVARLDGERTLDALWNTLHRASGDELPTQDEVIATLSQLMDAGLLQSDTMPDRAVLTQQRQMQQRRERHSKLNLFSFRLKLFNPAKLLDKLAPWQSIVWRPAAAIVWAALVGWGVFHALLEWNAIRAYAAVNLLTPRFLVLAWCVYPVLKALHELGHALAVRHWGGQVKEAGIAFFLFIPAPYVDASAATAFPSKWQRVAVSSAGIAVELLLAAVALLVWTASESGAVRDTAFAVMVIGALSTVTFNANPLMRFDGYYILCDLLELPNLATRSQRWWKHQLRRMLSGSGSHREFGTQGNEGLWLALYSPASWLYRLSVSILIVQWIAVKSISIALLALAWLGFSLIAKPSWSLVQLLLAPAHPGPGRWKVLLTVAGAGAALMTLLFIVPLPSSTLAAGVVWLPEHSQVRTDSDGRIAEILVQDGQRVVKGQPLVVTEEPALLARRARLKAQIAANQVEQASGWQKVSLQGRNASDEFARLQQELMQLDARIENLTLRAGTDGVLVMPHAMDMLGRHLAKGTLVAHVLAQDPMIVRATIPQDDIGRIKGGVQRISVSLADAGNQYFDGRLLRITPAATRQLPSMALGDKGGGDVLTDPSDPDGMRALEPVFLVDVQLTDRRVSRAGGHAWVRFEHPAQPLADTAWMRFRQLFLKAFSMEKD
ncbi:MAG TPA: HlyD family efflux transporter periplasmic adaptor subunit [Noviherbaspirillum sp.]|nr:HlyD family efflux transporter periplasmic adaptor subunit [Noviherbaspirillum sp.]